MNRFLAVLKWEVIRQYKNGFYLVSVFVLLIWIILFKQIQTSLLAGMMPMIILGNLSMTTYFFMAGLVLFEKGEGSLEAQVVTPVRSVEYLAAKVLSLSLLATVENLVITITLVGLHFNFTAFFIGTFLASVLLCLAGFLLVLRYDASNEFLIPSILYMLLLEAPIMAGLWMQHAFFWYIHPIYGSYLILQAATQSVHWLQILYGVAYLLAAIIFMFKLSLQAFNRFVVRSEGEKKAHERFAAL